MAASISEEERRRGRPSAGSRRRTTHVIPRPTANENDEVDERDEDAGERQDQQREVHLLHEHPVRRGRSCDVSVKIAARKVHGDEVEHREDRIREALRRQVGELPEDEREDDHRQERLQHRPRDADQRLLVAHLDVAPREDQREVASAPELPEVRQAAAPQAGRISVTGRLLWIRSSAGAATHRGRAAAHGGMVPVLPRRHPARLSACGGRSARRSASALELGDRVLECGAATLGRRSRVVLERDLRRRRRGRRRRRVWVRRRERVPPRSSSDSASRSRVSSTQRPVREPAREPRRRRRARSASSASRSTPATSRSSARDDVLARRARSRGAGTSSRAAPRVRSGKWSTSNGNHSRRSGRPVPRGVVVPVRDDGVRAARCATFTWAWYGSVRSAAGRAPDRHPLEERRPAAGPQDEVPQRPRTTPNRVGTAPRISWSVPARGHQNSSASLVDHPVGPVLGCGEPRHARDPLRLAEHLGVLADRARPVPLARARARRSVVPSIERWSVTMTRSMPSARW